MNPPTPCPCRVCDHPRPVDIAPGLTRLPRSRASFGEFRAALLRQASLDRRLTPWTAREQGDLGVLLVEMWSHACEIIAFADETISHEVYLRTARTDESLRLLVALLGYRPRPAIAATADVSIRAEGRQPIEVPARTGIRSGAVGDGPPQIFETTADITVHPLTNGFDVAVEPSTALGETAAGSGVAELSSLIVLLEAAGLVANNRVWIRTPTQSIIVTPTKVDGNRGPGPATATLTLPAPVELDAATAWSDVELWVSARRSNLWSIQVTGLSQPAISTGDPTTLFLDGLERSLAVGDDLVVERNGMHRSFIIASVAEVAYRIAADVDYSTDEGDYTLPGASVMVTSLVLDTDIDDPTRRTHPADTGSWTDSVSNELVVRTGWIRAGSLQVPDQTTVDGGANLNVGTDLDEPVPGWDPSRFAVVDRDRRSVIADGALDWQGGLVRLDDAAWDPPLRHPIRVDANVVTVTRGESVFAEVLGSGDAAQVNQRFTLANAPLTYLGPAASSGQDVAVSTLTVWVDGIRWDEVPFFVGCGPGDRVYVTETTESGETEVVFGDGVLGTRLPSGTDNVIADYRHGAGAESPDAESLTQFSEPMDGLTGVTNRAPAVGGADGEQPTELRTTAPRSALLLGRIVSRHDAAAAARLTPGVEVADAEYGWQPDRLQAGILVRYVGDSALQEGLRRRLRSLAERDVHIDAVPSPPQPVALAVTIVPDPRRQRADVEAAVRNALTGDGGALTPPVLGINGPLYRSRILGAIDSADGVEAVTGLLLDGTRFESFALSPPDGWHFDGTDGVTVAFEEASRG